MVKFALFTFRSVRVSVFQQRVQSVFRERERGVLLWSESSYDASLRMKKRENEKLCCENERNVPHLLQVNNIFVVRRPELIGIPPTFSSPTFSSVVLVDDDDDSASIRSLLGCSDANEESSRVLLSFVVLLVSLLLLLENGDSETTFQEDGCSSEDDSSEDAAFVVVFLTKERFRRREEEEEEEEEFVDLLLWRRRWSRWCEKTREQWYERDVMFNS